MKIFNLLRQKKGPTDEATRRAHLINSGRITEGRIFDVDTDDAGKVLNIFYSYHVSGVEYQSSQVLDAEQGGREDDYVPGTRVTVRYSPQQPGNSVVV